MPRWTSRLNRRERRAAEAGRRRVFGAAIEKLRCLACERVGQPMNKEHIWPRWVVARANAQKDAFNWIAGSAAPGKATVPLCVDCNSHLGTTIEGPVGQAFDALEQGLGLTGVQCALLVRWLWKFEGLFWRWEHPDGKYSDLWTVRERVCEDAAIRSVANNLSLAIGLIVEPGDDGVWPVGLDSPLSDQGICVAGVFGRVALASSFTGIAHQYFTGLDVVDLSQERILSNEIIFSPSTRFQTGPHAVQYMKIAAPLACNAHQEVMREIEKGHLINPVRRRRVELPGG